MATKRGSKRKSRIIALDESFYAVPDGVIESGNIRIILKNGVEIDLYVAGDDEGVASIYIDTHDMGRDAKGNRHELVLVGSHEGAFEISARRI